MEKYNKENLEKLCKIVNSYTELVEKLGLTKSYGNRKTVKKYIEIYSLNISHFGDYRHSNSGRKKLSKEKLLVEGKNTNNRIIKKTLLDNSLMDYKCDVCGLGDTWNGVSITLQLDHKNGVNNDNRLENLRFLCPNCHSQTDTHSGKNIKNKPNNKKPYCKCGSSISYGAEKCFNCLSKEKRKVVRPSMETLIDDIKILGYRGTGNKYGVSDNAIRKWVKKKES